MVVAQLAGTLEQSPGPLDLALGQGAAALAGEAARGFEVSLAGGAASQVALAGGELGSFDRRLEGIVEPLRRAAQDARLEHQRPGLGAVAAALEQIAGDVVGVAVALEPDQRIDAQEVECRRGARELDRLVDGVERLGVLPRAVERRRAVGKVGDRIVHASPRFGTRG